MFRLFHFHGIAYAAVGHLYVYKVADGGGDVGYVGRMVGLAVLHTPTHHQERYVGIVRIPCTVCRSFINFVAVYFIPSWLHDELDVRGVSHRGFFASITDFQSYYNANMDLIDIKAAQTLFDPEWPIYTRTNDSCPTHYYKTAQIRNSVVSNGCQVEGTIENSILGRGCIIHKDAVIKNSVILSGAEIGEGVHVENQVVDKMVKILHVKEVVSDPALPGYIKRRDIL